MKQAILICTVLTCAMSTETFAQTSATPAIPLSRVRAGTATSLAPATALTPSISQDPANAPTTVYVDPQTGEIIASPAVTSATPTTVITPRTRLQAVNEMEIDRRPSTVLQEWSDLPSDLPSDSPAVERPPSPLAAEVGALRWWLMMGEWDKVDHYLEGLDAAEANSIYRVILTKLRQTPSSNRVATHPAGQAYAEQNVLSPDDVWHLLLASPTSLDESTLGLLSSLLSSSFSNGNQPEPFVRQLEEYVSAESTAEKQITHMQAKHGRYSVSKDPNAVHLVTDQTFHFQKWYGIKHGQRT